MTAFVATINVPGYLPMDDEPPVFDTPAQAWEYLADERKRAEDDLPEWSDHECPDPNACGYTDTYAELAGLAGQGADALWDGTGSVTGDTPGYSGDHDLGLVYSVSAV